MMMGGGFMLDMMIKVKQNLAMLPSRQSKFKEGRRPEYTYKNQIARKFKFKEVSEGELDEVICQIRLDAREERRKRKLILPLSILAVIVILFILELIFRWIWHVG